MNILITGGAGYIGSILTRYLLEKRFTVTVFDNLQFGGESVIDLLQHNGFKLIHGDIRNKKELTSALKNIDSVIHLAALVGEPQCNVDPKITKDINDKGAKLVCDLSKKLGVKRFIHISTCSNYGISDTKHPATEEATLHPISLYATTKIAGEKYVITQTNNNFSVCVLRLATVYGISPRMRFDLLVNEIVRDALLTKKISLYQPLAWRPFIHVLDVARAIFICLTAPENKIQRQVFNVGNKNYQKVDIVNAIKKYIPDCRTEVIKNTGDRRDYNVNFQKVKKILRFKARVSLDKGIEEMLSALQIGIFKNPNDYRYTNVGWPQNEKKIY